MAVQRDNANVNRQLWGESRQSGVEAQVGRVRCWGDTHGRSGSEMGVPLDSLRPCVHCNQTWVTSTKKPTRVYVVLRVSRSLRDAHTVPSARSVALLPLPPTINGLILG